MPKQTDSTPDKLRPYISHGLDVQWRDGDKHGFADCPWCGREGKFAIVAQTGQWSCPVCLEGNAKGGGNVYVFLRMLWDRSFEETTPADYRQLAIDRTLEDLDTPIQWNLCRSIINGEWLVPGYGIDGVLKTLYRYTQQKDRKALLATATLGHYLTGMNLFDKKKPVVFLCEGVWDAMPLWEQLGKTKEAGEGFAPTASLSASLLSEANVLSFPGANTFHEGWAELFADKVVHLMAQNDHERRHPKTGKLVPPASFRGMKRITEILVKAKKPPRSINVLWWGERGFDTDLPSGFDVRDTFASVSA